jgi:hypothetical protein
VVNRVKKAAEGKHTILAENETIQGNQRPDLVTVKNNKATIIDITVPFENRVEALTDARQQKINKYVALARNNRFNEVKVDAIVLISLGTWDPPERPTNENDVLEDVLKIIQETVCVGRHQIFRDIYTEHITRVRQQ